MARGAYTETDAVRGLRQLVDFAEGGEGNPLALAEMGPAWLTAPAQKMLRGLDAEQIQTLHEDLRGFLRAAAGRPPLAGVRATMVKVELLPMFGYLRQPGKGGKRKLFCVNGTPRDVLLYQVATFLAVVGEDRLCFCPAPDCGRMFVKVGRREYCSERCQRRVFVSTYDPFRLRAQRKDRNGKKTR